MNETAKSGFLFVAVILLLFGIFCLRYRTTVQREVATVAARQSDWVRSKNPPTDGPSATPPQLQFSGPKELPSATPNRFTAVADRRTAANLTAPSQPEPTAPVAPPILPISPAPPGSAPPGSARHESGVQPAAFDAPIQLPSDADSNAQRLPEPVPTPAPQSTAFPMTPEPLQNPHSAASPTPGLVVTEADDSLWRISKSAYGRGDYYKALYLHNRTQIAHPDRIAAGVQIATPSADELRRLYPSACPEEPSALGP